MCLGLGRVAADRPTRAPGTWPATAAAVALRWDVFAAGTGSRCISLPTGR